MYPRRCGGLTPPQVYLHREHLPVLTLWPPSLAKPQGPNVWDNTCCIGEHELLLNKLTGELLRHHHYMMDRYMF